MKKSAQQTLFNRRIKKIATKTTKPAKAGLVYFIFALLA
jgi:hypothetical protein